MPREARAGDNDALLALAAACPMEAELTLCVRREPDFFAFNRLQGERWAVGVVDGAPGQVVGCIALAERCVYLHGAAARTMYVSDLKVHPDFRGPGWGVADALVEYARAFARAVDPTAPCLLAALAGNTSIGKRAGGPRGTPALHRFATVRTHAVLAVPFPRGLERHGLTVSHAAARDLDEMGQLWRAVAPLRQFAPVVDASGLARLIARAPGLEVSSYLLARRPDGRLAGFLALWDQRRLKETRVLRFSRRAAAARVALNLVAPVLGLPRLPRAGAPLHGWTAFQICVPPREPDVLRALLHAARVECRDAGLGFFTVGLDVADPLSAALAGGFWTVPTDVHVYVTTPSGRYDGPPLETRPVHFETALA
jgi:GNAT superfamily N-acetyltransferase